MAENKPKRDKPTFDCGLTKREQEICEMVARGQSSKQIAKQLFLSEGTVKNHITSIFEKTGAQNRAQLAVAYIAEFEQAETDMSALFWDADLSAQPDATLRLVGLTGLPDTIPITFSGRPFVIGRFDVSVGYRQCDFEFEKYTKAVSRRHAAIANSDNGCVIEDLNSRAGTYVNGNRIAPREPYPLVSGDQVSFGRAGADYLFEILWTGKSKINRSENYSLPQAKQAFAKSE